MRIKSKYWATNKLWILTGRRRTLPRLVVFVIGFAVMGAVLLVLVRAVTPTATIEPENGTYSSPIVAINDSNAAGGRAVRFGSNQTTSTYNALILSDRPVAFWNMSGSNSEADLSGNNRIGTYQGGTHAMTTLPNNDPATVFNGSSQYLTVPSSANFSTTATGELTWEAWIRPDVLQFPNDSGYGYIDWMGKCANYSPTCEWEARMYSTTNSEGRCNRLSAYIFNPSAGLGSAADWQPNCGLLQAGRWLHVVGEYQTKTTPPGCSSTYPGGINIWVNGVKWNQASHMPTGCMSQYHIIPAASNSPLNIGTMALETWFKGGVGKVALYNYPLTNSQIAAHYTAMTAQAVTGSCANTCSF